MCLLRFSQPQHSGQSPVLLWGKWLTKEHTMFSEEERERESAQGKKVREREGAGNLSQKVLGLKSQTPHPEPSSPGFGVNPKPNLETEERVAIRLWFFDQNLPPMPGPLAA